jgi:hypothetical protein
MPPFASQVLDEFVDRVYEQVQSAVSGSAPLDLGWLYVEPDSCTQILASLKWWREEGKTRLTFDEMLPV